MKLSGWGRYPIIESDSLPFSNTEKLKSIVKNESAAIAYGNGRSYGDSALAKKHIPMQQLNRMISFNASTGLLTCEAGVLLSDIIKTFLPRGWFLKVTPGTKLITVGGAVASDVHGKNHHIEGCFSQCIKELDLLLPDGSSITCSAKKNAEWFHATCGGMGLTGVVLSVSFYLKAVKSQWINQTTIKTNNLEDTFEAFETHTNNPYSVAWIDCLAKGQTLGRSLLMLGDFTNDGDLNYQPKKKINLPFTFPNWALNQFSVKLFNYFYYGRVKTPVSQQKVSIDTFFYPLDAIENWNKIYGANGFTQFQFILPKEHSLQGLKEILEKISNAGLGSFLAVLKLYGPANKNWLSFPMEGYSLALDFKMQPKLLPFIDALCLIVASYNGRVYLAKDALIKKEVFEQGYPKIKQFRQFRKQHALNKHFNSLQSNRLGL